MNSLNGNFGKNFTNENFSDILKEGFLTKQAENWRTWRTRYFILFKDGKLLGYDSGKPTNLGKCNNRFRIGLNDLWCN